MAKLLLTSDGLTNQNIAKQFLELIKKPVSSIKIVFVPTASRTKSQLKYVEKSKRELLALGILEQNILVLNLDHKITSSEVADCDVIYVCGGNTFYLLQQVRKTGFGKIIIDFINNGGLYLGVSAGSILVGPDIGLASPFDENDVQIKDLTGLKLTGVIVSPHYCEEEKEIIENFKKKTPYEVIPLNDEQALLIEDNKVKLVE